MGCYWSFNKLFKSVTNSDMDGDISQRTISIINNRYWWNRSNDLVKNLDEPNQIWAIFSDADAAVVGEGEQAFNSILQAVDMKLDLPNDNGVICNRKEQLVKLSTSYIDVSTLPSPEYGIWNLGGFWSPEPVLLYSPTRGCYWNKCTFAIMDSILIALLLLPENVP